MTDKELKEFLIQRRTTTQEDVDTAAAEHDRYDLTAEERFANVGHSSGRSAH